MYDYVKSQLAAATKEFVNHVMLECGSIVQKVAYK